MRSVWRPAPLGALALAFVLSAVGCGETVIDAAKTEAAVEQNLEHATGRKVASVNCPSEVEVEKGKTFQCVVSFENGKDEVETLKILNQDADVAVTDLRPQR
jgi:hypothetical protein